MDQKTAKKARSKRIAREQREAGQRQRWTSRVPSPQSVDEAGIAAREVPTSTQLGSKFFTMLPLEIRQTIYSLALGREKLELKILDDPKRDTFTVHCYNAARLLSFPKTCRLAYAESIESVYKYNTFSTNNMASILFLPSCVAPPLFNVIQSLDFRFVVRSLYMQTWPLKSPPDDEATYEETWAVLSGMRGLKSLDVHLFATASLDAEIEEELFQPMAKCQGIETFHVTVDWKFPRNGSKKKSWPFQIEWAT